ncbi:hypothetical protein [Mameliella alba]|uniref:hypothetical protein n=1 Tax=Mameliella alba TaxID=561184 RepID=UPI0010559DA4|nr:hypothetical protein [Mameliella alba]GGF75619.1 hypothetical protein GCM10011319_40040 [Mameliella alba]
MAGNKVDLEKEVLQQPPPSTNGTFPAKGTAVMRDGGEANARSALASSADKTANCQLLVSATLANLYVPVAVGVDRPKGVSLAKATASPNPSTRITLAQDQRSPYVHCA